MRSFAHDPAAPARRRLPRLTLARRLAAGLPPALAAEGSGLSPEAVGAMLAEQGFRRTVAVYAELLAAPKEQRLERLYGLALQVLEQALAEGCRLTLLFLLRERGLGRDPVASLAQGIERRLKAGPPPEESSPSATPQPEENPAPPSAGAANDPPVPRPPAARPDPLDAAAWRAADRLRRTMLTEAGLAAAARDPELAGTPADPDEPRDDLDLIDPVEDPLGAAVHRLHRAADAADAARADAAKIAAQRAAAAKAARGPAPAGAAPASGSSAPSFRAGAAAASEKNALLEQILARQRARTKPPDG